MAFGVKVRVLCGHAGGRRAVLVEQSGNYEVGARSPDGKIWDGTRWKDLTDVPRIPGKSPFLLLQATPEEWQQAFAEEERARAAQAIEGRFRTGLSDAHADALHQQGRCLYCASPSV